MGPLVMNSADHPIDLFPLTEGQINVGSTSGANSDGVFQGMKMFKCVSAGSITLFWYGTVDNTTNTVLACQAGDTYAVQNAFSFKITSGTFHVA